MCGPLKMFIFYWSLKGTIVQVYSQLISWIWIHGLLHSEWTNYVQLGWLFANKSWFYFYILAWKKTFLRKTYLESLDKSDHHNYHLFSFREWVCALKSFYTRRHKFIQFIWHSQVLGGRESKKWSGQREKYSFEIISGHTSQVARGGGGTCWLNFLLP